MLWFLGLCAAFAPACSVAQSTPRSAIAGTVRDTSGRPIANAEVLTDSLGRHAISDDSGRFHLDSLKPGRNGFTVRRLGFDPASFETALAPNATLLIQVTLNSVQSLGAVVVSGERTIAGLAKAGFYEREQRGLGRFIRPESIDSLSNVTRPSQLLQNMNGINVSCAKARCSVQSRTPPYCLHLFVDGRYTAGETPFTALDEALSAASVLAIEVYRHPSEVPTEFQAPLVVKSGRGVTGQAGCGAIAVWTKAKGH
ncbi:MAG: carboxypeptidase-like regulatory domain-containing protein [Gemmatimonadetes bacterium]|nr:carboxypeptidase-like regulatory domain-containing protein [Gemmatimonadota bacterium]